MMQKLTLRLPWRKGQASPSATAGSGGGLPSSGPGNSAGRKQNVRQYPVMSGNVRKNGRNMMQKLTLRLGAKGRPVPLTRRHG